MVNPLTLLPSTSDTMIRQSMSNSQDKIKESVPEETVSAYQSQIPVDAKKINQQIAIAKLNT